jgi:signal peptidase II
VALATTATALLAADVATKVWAVARLSHHDLSLLGDHLVLHEQRNPGAAFSIAGGATVLFTLVAAGIAAVIVRTARRLTSTAWAVTLGLLLGGALGNLADRLFRDPGPLRGHVVDFIDLHWNGHSVWPVFNVADMAVVTGALLALLLSWRGVPLGDTEP